ncbi:UNVERIFIED_CONTAM: Negative regulator of systemic acquired resistance SNI1 [Sesamum indicum]
MEKRRRTGGEGGDRGMEENTMAILDTSGRAFLEAVRTASLLPDNGSAPTRKMFEAIFHILKDADSVDLIIESYQLLIELDKRFPRVYLSKGEQSDSMSPLKAVSQIVMVEEAWFPFNFGLDSYNEKVEARNPSRSSVDSSGFHALIQEIAKVATEMKSETVGTTVSYSLAAVSINITCSFADTYDYECLQPNSSVELLWTNLKTFFFHTPKVQGRDRQLSYVTMRNVSRASEFLKNMLLLQYLITVLEGDFLPRNCSYQENMNWIILRESLLNMLLGSRKIVYKGLVKDCLSLMCDLSQLTVFSEETGYLKNSSGKQHHEIDYAMALALPEVKKCTCTVLKTLLVMIMELDSSRRIADHQGLTTRADGVRTPVVDIILDELIYDNDILFSFLQVFDPKWKLEIVVQYFLKYITKYSVQTRRSSGMVNIENLDGVLKCLSNRTSTRSIIKKISTELIQLLLAYAFQAYLLLSYQHLSKGLSDKQEDDKSNCIVEVCKNMISAFTCLRQENPMSLGPVEWLLDVLVLNFLVYDNLLSEMQVLGAFPGIFREESSCIVTGPSLTKLTFRLRKKETHVGLLHQSFLANIVTQERNSSKYLVVKSHLLSSWLQRHRLHGKDGQLLVGVLKLKLTNQRTSMRKAQEPTFCPQKDSYVYEDFAKTMTGGL